MVMKVCTVFDRIDGCGAKLFIDRSLSRAAVNFAAAIEQNNKELVSKGYSPLKVEDYELRHIADYDDESTTLIPVLPPVVVPVSFGDGE